MSGKTRLSRAAVAYAVGIASILPSFNLASSETSGQAQPDQDQPTPKRVHIVQDSAAQQRMADTLKTIDFHIKEKALGAKYSAPSDPKLSLYIETLKLAVSGGANPNHYPETGYSIANATGLSAFHAAVEVALRAQRPDLVQMFIDHGARAGESAPDGWQAMDYALINFIDSQKKSRAQMICAAQIIAILQKNGVPLDSVKQAPLRFGATAFSDYLALARNAVGLEVLKDTGLITQAQYQAKVLGKPELTRIFQANVPVTRSLLETYGAKFSEFPDAVPGGPEPYIMKPGDTLQSIAERFYKATGQTDAKTMLLALAQLNHIDLDQHGNPARQPGTNTTILIPVPYDRQIGTLTVREDTETAMDLAKRVQPISYNGKNGLDILAGEINTLNGLPADKINTPGFFKKDQQAIVSFITDVYTLLPTLKPPAHYKGNREVDLFVIEEKDSHAKDTYRVSNHTAYAINPSARLEDIHQWNEFMAGFPTVGQHSDALSSILSNQGGPVQDRLLFSQSIVMTLEEIRADYRRQLRGPDHPDYESTRMFLDFMNAAKPILFNASGNFLIEEGRYIQSFTTIHSPRTVLVGAVGSYPTKTPDVKMRAIAPYSSYGGDICAPLPPHFGNQMEGTSFSTPLMAALYRQMSEWYGDRLSFEEIIAAAMMTASQDMMDYADPSAARDDENKNPEKFTMKGVEFRTNGGGIPQSERCGAGLVDITRWQSALDRMIDIKQRNRSTIKDEGFSNRLTIGEPSTIRHQSGKTEFIYRMKIPQDMTLGRLTFSVPQFTSMHSEVVVKSPAGFESHLGKSLNDIISTFNFAYEDVRAGDYIELRTNQPLGPTAGVLLRGHAPGSAIATLRNQLRAQSLIPAPLQIMSGKTVLGPAPSLDVLKVNPQSGTPQKQGLQSPANNNTVPMPIMPVPQRKNG